MLFSVLVPVYNIEAYVKACVDSVLAQTFRDFELILVDDGATDGCPALCDSFAQKDSRVRVIHKPNGGLVSARQAAMQAARGEYVVHVDGDDWIAPELLEKAVEIIEKHSPDMISFGFTYHWPNRRETVCEPVDAGYYDRKKIKEQIHPIVLMAPGMTHMFYYQCGKVLRRRLLHPIQMAVNPGISLGEDVACVIPAYFQADSVYISHIPMYFYRCRAGSDSRSFNLRQYRQLALGVEGLERIPAEPSAGLPAQISRYTAFICFGLLLAAVDAREYGMIGQIKNAMAHPTLQRHIQRAAFKGITPKTRVTCWLLRKNRIRAAYGVLRICRMVKKG